MSAESVSPGLSVVVPVHNEVENLVGLVREIGAALDGRLDYEIVYVDDGSDDGTGERLSTLTTEFPRLRVVRLPKRSGQSSAIVAGVRSSRAPWVATLDGDGQNDPADIPRLLEAVESPSSRNGLVIGQRRRRQDSMTKRLASRVANTVRARLLGDGTPDTGCGLKLFERDAFLSLPHFDHMHRFLPALFRRAGWRVASIPVSHRPRRYGRSHYGVLDRLGVGLADMAGVFWLQRRTIPSSNGRTP